MGELPLLEARNLQVHFTVRRHRLGSAKAWLRAVDDVSFQVAPGETLGLVGESGCGKTTLGRAAIRLIELTSGEIFFEQKNITRVNRRTLRSLRRGFQMIFQDPYGSLDPRLPVEDLIGEALD